ncbi:MAG: hypothetical protein Q7R95_09385 [bacterium]|nr:hypothetical protein [bacterium]
MQENIVDLAAISKTLNLVEQVDFSLEGGEQMRHQMELHDKMLKTLQSGETWERYNLNTEVVSGSTVAIGLVDHLGNMHVALLESTDKVGKDLWKYKGKYVIKNDQNDAQPDLRAFDTIVVMPRENQIPPEHLTGTSLLHINLAADKGIHIGHVEPTEPGIIRLITPQEIKAREQELSVIEGNGGRYIKAMLGLQLKDANVINPIKNTHMNPEKHVVEQELNANLQIVGMKVLRHKFPR